MNHQKFIPVMQDSQLYERCYTNIELLSSKSVNLDFTILLTKQKKTIR